MTTKQFTPAYADRTLETNYALSAGTKRKSNEVDSTANSKKKKKDPYNFDSFAEFQEWWHKPDTRAIVFYEKGSYVAEGQHSCVSEVTVFVDKKPFTFAIKYIYNRTKTTRFLNLDVLNKNLTTCKEVMPTATFEGSILCPIYHTMDNTEICFMGMWTDVATVATMLHEEPDEDKLYRLCNALLHLATQCNSLNIAVTDYKLDNLAVSDDCTIACLLDLESIIFTKTCFKKLLGPVNKRCVYLTTTHARPANQTLLAAEYKIRSNGSLKPEHAKQLQYFATALFYISVYSIATNSRKNWYLRLYRDEEETNTHMKFSVHLKEGEQGKLLQIMHEEVSTIHDAVNADNTYTDDDDIPNDFMDDGSASEYSVYPDSEEEEEYISEDVPLNIKNRLNTFYNRCYTPLYEETEEVTKKMLYNVSLLAPFYKKYA